jgi:phenylacetate-CoA ligase
VKCRAQANKHTKIKKRCRQDIAPLQIHSGPRYGVRVDCSQKGECVTYELSVISPCYNEEANLRALVNRLQSMFDAEKIVGEIVLVNDGSVDHTGTVVDLLAHEHSNVVAIHHSGNRGIEAGWKSGLGASHGKLVCLIDADLQNLPEDISRLYREIRESGADVVQGYRTPAKGAPKSRHIFSKTLNAILNTSFGMHLRDNKSGFIICEPNVLGDILQHRGRYRYFQSLIMVAAAAKGYSIREIETVFDRRRGGTSFIPRVPVAFICYVLVDIIKAIYEYRIVGQHCRMMGEHAENASSVVSGLHRD